MIVPCERLAGRLLPLSAALILAIAVGAAAADRQEDDVQISAAAKDADGFLVHSVESPFQEGATEDPSVAPGSAS